MEPFTYNIISPCDHSRNPALARVLAALREAGCDPRPCGSGWAARCPGHDDRDPSLSIGVGRRGQVLLYCHAGCTLADILRALGMECRDLYPPLCVASMAAALRIPEGYLRDFGWMDVLPEGTGCTIPYRDADGTCLRVRRRTAWAGRDRFEWAAAGHGIYPYGRDRLAQARSEGYMVLCEGETDAATCWYAGVPALGLPGADTARVLDASDLAGIGRVYVAQECDGGGAAFVAGMRDRLRDLGYQGRAHVLAVPERLGEHGDLNDWYVDGGSVAAFQAALRQAMQVAPSLADVEEPFGIPVPFWEVREEPASYVIDRMLVAGVPTMLEAPSKVGKSTLAVAIARAAGTKGASFLGRAVLDDGPVLYIVPDDVQGRAGDIRGLLELGGQRPEVYLWGPPTSREARDARFDALQAAMQVAGREDRIRAMAQAFCDAWRPQIKRIGAKTVVVDMLESIVPPGVDWNAYGTVQTAMRPVATLAADTGAAFVILHHGGKYASAENPAIAANGSIGISGAVANLWGLERKPGKTQIVLRLQGRHLREETIHADYDPATGAYSLIQGHVIPARATEPPATVRVLDALEGGPLSERALSEATGLTRRRVSDALRWLEQHGDVKHNGQDGKQSAWMRTTT